MDRRVTHPTKEQVRAYMVGREHASRPPPAPEEIRQQLGWHVLPPTEDGALLSLCLLPATFAQLTLQTAIAYCLTPLRAGMWLKRSVEH
jgi:hypothetical protein